MSNGQPVIGSLYIYAPNKIAPIIFATLFSISALGHIWQCQRYKCWKLIWLQPLCAILFAAGYALRGYGAFNYSYENKRDLIVFIMSQVLIYICPPFLELANYHILGRIFNYIPYLAPLTPSLVLSIFGALMALVETLNALGVALSSNPTSPKTKQAMGNNLTIAAVALQLGIIVVFVVLAGIFHRKTIKARVHVQAVRTPMITLYASMSLILVRCIYRLIDHLGHTTKKLDDMDVLMDLSSILRYEWFFYVFEASLMLINSFLWNIWNPGRYLPRDQYVCLATDGRTEVRREDIVDERPFGKRVASWCTSGIFFRKEGGGG